MVCGARGRPEHTRVANREHYDVEEDKRHDDCVKNLAALGLEFKQRLEPQLCWVVCHFNRRCVPAEHGIY